jgi:hypothetical protein
MHNFLSFLLHPISFFSRLLFILSLWTLSLPAYEIDWDFDITDLAPEIEALHKVEDAKGKHDLFNSASSILESIPSAIVADCVNAISGDY